MRNYTNSLAEVVSAFPGAVYTPRERKNRANNYTVVVETGTVPIVTYGYTTELTYGILRQSALVVRDTTDSEDLTAVPFTTAPAAGEVAVNYNAGLLTFHASLSGHNLSVTYYPLGSVVTSNWECTLQQELVAIETELSSGPQYITTVIQIAGEAIAGTIAGYGYVHLQGATTRTLIAYGATAGASAAADYVSFCVHAVGDAPTSGGVVGLTAGRLYRHGDGLAAPTLSAHGDIEAYCTDNPGLYRDIMLVLVWE